MDVGTTSTVTVTGLDLRAVCLVVLAARGQPMALRDLDREVRAAGFTPPGRPGKAIADALRWEVRRGRVRRVGPGRYAAGVIAKSTGHRMRARVARMRNRRDPPVPPAPPRVAVMRNR
jgi:hypothetical protein